MTADPRDEIARLRAEADLTREGMREFAGTTAGFFEGLMENGFNADQAFQLTTTWLAETLRASLGGGEEDG